MWNTLTLKERFDMQYEIAESGCWLWTGTKSVPKGYGRIKNGQKGLGAHRVSWRLHRGPVPKGKMVCHRCDVTACVNPGHLFLGTNKENIQDSINKGRFNKNKARGERSGQAKLTRYQVSLIRGSKLSSNKLSTLFSISRSQVKRIKRGQTWAWL